MSGKIKLQWLLNCNSCNRTHTHTHTHAHSIMI